MRWLCEVGFNRGLHPGSSKISSCPVASRLILINSSEGRTIVQHTVKCIACIWFTNLAALVTGADTQLVDLRLGRVGPLLCVVQLVLQLPVLGHVGVCLLLLHRDGSVQ